MDHAHGHQHRWQLQSRHWTSEGLVGYQRCDCGGNRVVMVHLTGTAHWEAIATPRVVVPKGRSAAGSQSRVCGARVWRSCSRTAWAGLQRLGRCMPQVMSAPL